MLRRQFLSFAAAGLVAACTGGTSADTTVQGIIDWLKTNCSFATNIQAITAVIISIIGSFNAELGGGAVVIAGIAKQVEDMVCNAVKQQAAQLKASGNLKASASNEIEVVVNGVKVPGTYTGS